MVIYISLSEHSEKVPKKLKIVVDRSGTMWWNTIHCWNTDKAAKKKWKKFLTSEKLSVKITFAVKTSQTSSSFWKENVQKKELDRKMKEW